jgi:predicted nucleic acid-binding protein
MTDPSWIRIYLDTNAFIEVFEKGTDYSERLWQIYRNKHPRRVVISSELTLAEILVKPLENMRISGDVKQVNNYCLNIADRGSVQRIVPIGRSVLETAARIRAFNKRIKLPDAIHLATATLEKTDFFVSNDTDLARAVESSPQPMKIGQFLTFDKLSLAPFIIQKP